MSCEKTINIKARASVEERKAYATGFINGLVETCIYELGLTRKEVLDSYIKFLEDSDIFNKHYEIIKKDPCSTCPWR